MPLEALVEPKVVTTGKLRLFSLYVDFAAAGQARGTAAAVARQAGPHWQTLTELWKLDSLTASDAIRTMLNADAADADALIIAVGSLNHREPKLTEWLNSLAVRKANRPSGGLLIGLLGDAENRSPELEWMVQQFIYCARQMNRELVMHWVEANSIDDFDWLKASVEALLAAKRSAGSRTFPPEAVAAFG